MKNCKEENVEMIMAAFLELCEDFVARGNNLESLKDVIKRGEKIGAKIRIFSFIRSKKLAIILLTIITSIIAKLSIFDDAMKNFYENRCIMKSNYFVWEFTRPISKCDYCRGIVDATILPNLTREEFSSFAYSPRPIIVKGAAGHWPAKEIYNLKFFRDIYDSVDDAYASFDEDCQFLRFKSNFENLREVLEMPDERAMNPENENSWYVGWKNCNPRILDTINRYYEPPHFLPADAEIPATNFIFLGYEEGATMHLDYISRLMWQGQIIGRKTWTVAPTPECDDVCRSFNFSVETGDVVLLDTRIWYHATHVENGLFSLTLTSEYG